MGWRRKIRGFLSLDRRTKWLLLEAFFYLGMARILIQLPFTRLAPYLGQHMAETNGAAGGENRKIIRQIAAVIHLAGRHTYWQSKCLVRAIAGTKMLKRRGIEYTLYLGTGKDSEGRLEAHAWLRSGADYVTGYEEMARFQVIGTFAYRPDH